MRCNTWFAVLLLGLSVLMSGCGSEEGSSPVLTDVLWPLTLPVQYLFDPIHRKAQLAGSAGFEDPDGDVVLLSVTWQNCGRETAKRHDIVQEDLKGTKIGKIPFFAMISTECPIGIYEVNLSATDGLGLTSNVLPVPYEIYGSLE